jgi:hypothetical protein
VGHAADGNGSSSAKAKRPAQGFFEGLVQGLVTGLSSERTRNPADPVARMEPVRKDREETGREMIFRATDGASGQAPIERAQRERRYVARAVAARSPGPVRGSIPGGAGAPLPASVRHQMEPKLGASLDGVRVHTDGESARTSQDLGARAFTVGSDVHFNAGEFNPGTKEGDRLLAHELTHVIQGQKSGVRRKEISEGEGGIEGDKAKSTGESGDDESLEVSEPGDPAEKEADATGDDVAEDLHEGGDESGREEKKIDQAAPAPVAAKRISPVSGGPRIFRAEEKGPPPAPSTSQAPQQATSLVVSEIELGEGEQSIELKSDIEDVSPGAVLHDAQTPLPEATRAASTKPGASITPEGVLTLAAVDKAAVVAAGSAGEVGSAVASSTGVVKVAADASDEEVTVKGTLGQTVALVKAKRKSLAKKLQEAPVAFPDGFTANDWAGHFGINPRKGRENVEKIREERPGTLWAEGEKYHFVPLPRTHQVRVAKEVISGRGRQSPDLHGPDPEKPKAFDGNDVDKFLKEQAAAVPPLAPPQLDSPAIIPDVIAALGNELKALGNDQYMFNPEPELRELPAGWGADEVSTRYYKNDSSYVENRDAVRQQGLAKITAVINKIDAPETRQDGLDAFKLLHSVDKLVYDPEFTEPNRAEYLELAKLDADHSEAIADHWVRIGHSMKWADRKKWVADKDSDPPVLKPMNKRLNMSKNADANFQDAKCTKSFDGPAQAKGKGFWWADVGIPFRNAPTGLKDA